MHQQKLVWLLKWLCAKTPMMRFESVTNKPFKRTLTGWERQFSPAFTVKLLLNNAISGNKSRDWRRRFRRREREKTYFSTRSFFASSIPVKTAKVRSQSTERVVKSSFTQPQWSQINRVLCVENYPQHHRYVFHNLGTSLWPSDTQTLKPSSAWQFLASFDADKYIPAFLRVHCFSYALDNKSRFSQLTGYNRSFNQGKISF